MIEKHIWCSRNFLRNSSRDFLWNPSIGSSKNFSRNLTGDSYRDYSRFFLVVFWGIALGIPRGTYRGGVSKNFVRKKFLGEFLKHRLGNPGEILIFFYEILKGIHSRFSEEISRWILEGTHGRIFGHPERISGEISSGIHGRVLGKIHRIIHVAIFQEVFLEEFLRGSLGESL